MKTIIKLLYIALAFFIILLSLIFIWSASYSNYYVRQLDYAISEQNYEFLLKNYDYYLEEPIHTKISDEYKLHLYAVILLNRNQEGKVTKAPAFSFYITDVDQSIIHFSDSDKDDKAKMVVSCDGFKKEYPIFSHEYKNLNLLNFELNLDEIKEKCIDDITIELFDHENYMFFNFTTNQHKITIETIENDGIQGYSTSESLKKLFPTHTIVTLISVLLLYIIIFILIWIFFNYLIKKWRKNKSQSL